jgi:hypothetical protein
MCSLVVSQVFKDILKERAVSSNLKLEAAHRSEMSVNIYITTWCHESRLSAVGIATGYGLDDRRDRSSSPGRMKNLHYSMSFRPVLESTQPPIQWVPGVLSLGVKRPGRESDKSPPTSAEVKKMRIYKTTPTYAFMA